MASREDDIEQKLNDIIDSFKIRSLAYYLHFESSERKLAQDVKNIIKEKYGREKFMPAIDWAEAFGDLADSDILDEKIQNYLDSIKYEDESFILPKDRLKNMIWNNSRDEGKKVLSEFNS